MSPAKALIVSYGLPNYAIRIRPYERARVATLEVWPAGTTAVTKNGPHTLSAWPPHFDKLVNMLGSAKSRLHIVPG